MIAYVFAYILLIAAVAFFAGRAAARRLVREGTVKLHSRPLYHGAYAALWVAVPAFIVVVGWLILQNPLIDALLLATLPTDMLADASQAQRALVLSEIKNVAAGRIFAEPSEAVRAAATTYVDWTQTSRWAMAAVVFAITAVPLLFVRARLSSEFQARNHFEKAITALMMLCSVIAIVTTAGIVASLLFEAYRFFERVPLSEFLFGLNWEPQIALRPDQVAGKGAFGAVPVFTGTILIATVAMIVATPIGLFSAIYLVEYANERVRAIVKPALEILAGIPTVVYGFFAVLIVAPAMRDFGSLFGVVVSPNSALAAGVVMGIMLIPFISSLSDDALRSVPTAMRDGSLALGATAAETMARVLIPAALPGIMGGILLAVSRAVGETMIVVMAAGLIARLTFNPLDSVTAVTVQIVTLLVGDTEFDNPKTLAAFALGLMLFVLTLLLNVVALRIVQKYREAYD